MLGLAVVGLLMYTGVEVYRRYHGYDSVNEEDEKPPQQKRIQSMPLFYAHAYQATPDPPPMRKGKATPIKTRQKR
jgi:hypothetical protein